MAGVVDIAPRVQIDGCLFPSHRPRLGAADWLTRGRRDCGLRLSSRMWLRQDATRRLLICVIWQAAFGIWHLALAFVHMFVGCDIQTRLQPIVRRLSHPACSCNSDPLLESIARTAQFNILFQPIVHTCDILQVPGCVVFIQILADDASSHPRSSHRTPIGLSSLPWQHPASASTHRGHLSRSSPRP
jgi:hypothetical protein